MKLSPHFNLEEFTDSDTATRMGIGNNLPDALLRNALSTAKSLEQVRSLLDHPMHINSGYRCEELERVLCDRDYTSWCSKHGYLKSEKSWSMYFSGKAHPRMLSVDFVCPEFGPPLKIVKTIESSGIKFDQLIQEGNWVHISFDQRMRQQVLTASFSGGTPHYTNGA